MHLFPGTFPQNILREELGGFKRGKWLSESWDRAFIAQSSRYYKRDLMYEC